MTHSLYRFLEKMPVTDHIETPPDTIVKSLVIDDAYKENALTYVKSMLKGNQYDPDKVELKAFEGEIVQFQAENMLTILTKISNKTVAGRMEGPVKVDSDVNAKQAMHNDYMSLFEDRDTERKIRDVVIKRNTQGFADDNITIPLPFWKKEYVHFEACVACRSKGTIICQPCSGKGVDQCTRCNGSGMGRCTHCSGSQMVMGPNNQKIQCPVCHGGGRTSCTYCNQTGRIQCRTCRSKGITPCPTCKGNAWNSIISILEIEARTRFDYPRDRLPEKVVALIEKYGANIKEHADITISDAQESVVNKDDLDKAKEEQDADQKNDLRIPVLYNVSLPYGHIEYDIDGKTYYTFLFGKNCKLDHVSPFIDDVIKDGVRKLHDASENRGNVGENLQKAASYRTVREGILYAAMYPLAKAKKVLKKSNSLGLSDGLIQDIVTNADKALKNITKKPRTLGVVYAALLNIVVLGGYFLTPLRSSLLSNIPNVTLHPICDVALFIALSYVGVILIQMVAQSALEKTMKTFMPKNAKKAPPPKLGDKGYIHFGVSIIIFLILIEMTRHIGSSPVSWYASLFN